MTKIDQELALMKLEVESSRVATAKHEMLLRIKESEVNIQRLKESIVQQDTRLEELKILISKLQEEISNG